MDQLDGMGAILRIAAVVGKEESMQKVLKTLMRHKNGISKTIFVRRLEKWGYQEKLMQQLLYFRLIGETKNGEIAYYITENGRRILIACGG